MKLYFKYGAMNSGKTMEILRTAHNYEENGYKVLLVKPKCDTKGEDYIVSRVGMKRKVDYLLEKDELISSLNLEDVKLILVDEAQFLSRNQVDDLWILTKKSDITTFCYGLKSDFKTNAFPGSMRLFEVADKLEEIATLCSCGAKATFNMRLVDGKCMFDGNQVVIDGTSNVTYIPVCGKCYLEMKEQEHKLVRERK